MIECYFQDQLRWSFGFENPNKAAALIASLLPFVWLAARAGWKPPRPTLKWPLVLLGGVAVCAGWGLLFMTYSRGGIVAAAAGFLYIGWRKRSALLAPTNRSRLALAIATCLGVTLLFAGTNAAERSTQWVAKREGSVENRFELWRGGLEMIAQIPQGVGQGKSGAVYMQWFQPLGSTTRYRTLVNSYLTFTAEQGLAIFGGVLFLVTAVWITTKRDSHGKAEPAIGIAARGSLIAFATAGLFSTTMEEWTLWTAPVVCLAVLAMTAYRSKADPQWLCAFRFAIYSSFGTCAALFVAGWGLSLREPLRISASGDAIAVTPAHSASQQCYHVWSDENVLGEDSGKLIRRLASERGSQLTIGGESHNTNATLVVIGDSVFRLAGSKPAKALVLIAPAKMDEDAALGVLKNSASVVLFTPSFDDDGRVSFWDTLGPKMGINPVKLQGVGSQVEWAWDDVVNHLR